MKVRPLEWAKGFFSEEAKSTSSSRLIRIVVVFAILFVWAGLSIYMQQLLEIHYSLLLFISIVMGQGILQKNGEIMRDIKQMEVTKEIKQIDAGVAATEIRADRDVAVAEAVTETPDGGDSSPADEPRGTR